MTSLISKLVFLVSLCLSTVGCAKPKPVTQIEYIEVKVPVHYKLERPERPEYTNSDNVPTYLLKLMEYTTKLEVIIDENNKKG